MKEMILRVVTACVAILLFTAAAFSQTPAFAFTVQADTLVAEVNGIKIEASFAAGDLLRITATAKGACVAPLPDAMRIAL